MSKMAEMAQTIEELRTAAVSINAAADWLYQQFSGDDDEAKATEAPAKKEPNPELKLNIINLRKNPKESVNRFLSLC